MKTRMLIITLAAVLGLLGVVAVFAYAHQANQRAVNGLKAETVLMANSEIPAGTSLNRAQQNHLLGTEKVPVSSLSTTPVQSVSTANEHMVVSANVAPNQILLQNMLTSAADVTASGSFTVPKNMVAVTVDMCVAEAVANYIGPGSGVAVFDTMVSGSGQVQRTCDAQRSIVNGAAIRNKGLASTVLVLREARVLAVGPNPAAQSTSSRNNATTAADPSSSASSTNTEVLVTLAVTQADAERLILIAEVGMPYMALVGSNSATAIAPPVNLFQFGQQP